MYAFVNNNIIERVPVNLPASARRLDNQAWVMGLRNATVADREACGYYVVTEVAQPTPPAGQVLNPVTYQLNAGRPLQVWTPRAMTTAELARAARITNALTLRDVADAAAFLTANQAYVDWYEQPAIQTLINGTGVMTAAQLTEAVRRLGPQVARLTKGVNRLTRVVVGDALLDTTAGA